MQTRIPGPWVAQPPLAVGQVGAVRTFRTPTIILASLFLAVDAIFGALHLMWCCSDAGLSIFFSIEKDRGFAEIYQYVKTFWATALLMAVYLRVRTGIYLAWGVVTGFLLMDDALSLHESLGRIAVASFDLQPAFALRSQDFGELMVVGVIGATLLALVAAMHRRADAPARAHSWQLLQMLLLLAVFGVVFDLVHSMAGSGTPAAFVALLEDGGEMVVMSLIAAYCFELCCLAYGEERAAVRADLSGSAAGAST